MLLSHILRSTGASVEPVTNVASANTSDDSGNLTLSGTFEAGDVVIFTVNLSLLNTATSLTPAATATFDGNAGTLVFSDAVTSTIDHRHVHTFMYTVPSSTSSIAVVWTGLTQTQIDNNAADIFLRKFGVVTRGADATPVDSSNISLTADGSTSVTTTNGGYVYSFVSTFKSDGRGDTWSSTTPSGGAFPLFVVANERLIGAYYTDRTAGVASFSYIEPVSEPHFLIGHFISLEAA